MKIKMITTASGPNGCFLSGWEYDLPEDMAISFVEGGYADSLENAKPKAVEIEVEVATAPGPEERAEVKPKTRAKARRRTRSVKK
jgi:hypothetical protein